MPKNQPTETEQPSKFAGMTEGNPDNLPAVPEAAGALVFPDDPGFDSSDVMFPKLRLAQGLTQEVQSGDARPGNWLLTGYDPEEEVVIVPVKVIKRRELREAEGDRNIVCRSANAITGVGEPGGECARCPFAAYGGVDGHRCAFIYTYAAWSVTHQMPVIIDFKGTAISAAKSINGLIIGQKLGRFAVRLTSRLRDERGRRYYVPTPTLVKDLDQDEFAKAYAAFGGGRPEGAEEE